jgi:NAD(P)-dependent dehydrogenase (short-subunit alcohol dehydrogenase family)
MPTAGTYGASKAAGERWAESLAHEIAPFGLGVSVLVAGAFKTDILSLTPFDQRPDSAYDAFRESAMRMEAPVQKMAMPPARFALALEASLSDTAPYVRHFVGRDVRMLAVMQRMLPNTVIHKIGRAAMRVPKPGSLLS